jgi:pimeloyl-ACP methyl ester carboxylesterase
VPLSYFDIASIRDDTDSRLSHAARVVPVVLVPGIGGSTLQTSGPVGTRTMVWNPSLTSSDPAGGFAADPEILGRLSTPLIPWEAEVDRAALDEAIARGLAPDSPVHDAPLSLIHRLHAYYVRHFGAVLYDDYGPLVTRLAFAVRDLPGNTALRVYCAGYDWRQSNATSAAGLQDVVGEAMHECGGEAPILIAHSMGGLVARHYCRHNGGGALIRALFLLGSPTLGAVEPYVFLKKGITTTGLRFAATGASHVFDLEHSRGIARRFPGIYELAANPIYCQSVNPHFARFDSTMTGYAPSGPLARTGQELADASDYQRFYDDIFTGMNDVYSERAMASANMTNAINFHTGLMDGGRAYIPENTHAVYGTGIDTVTSIQINNLAARGSPAHHAGGNYNEFLVEIVEEETPDGDSSVPEASAHPDRSLLIRGFVGEMPIAGVHHRAMGASVSVFNYIKAKIHDLLAE